MLLRKCLIAGLVLAFCLVCMPAEASVQAAPDAPGSPGDDGPEIDFCEDSPDE